ncbi:hypothetical protein P4S66_01995 [Pseudoalteromonas sp. B129b]
MFKNNLSANLTVLIAGFLVSQNVIAVPIPPPLSDPGNIGGWTINNQMSDEFNTNEFDSSVWYNLGKNGNYYGEWKGRAPSQYNPDNISVSGGVYV